MRYRRTSDFGAFDKTKGVHMLTFRHFISLFAIT